MMKMSQSRSVDQTKWIKMYQSQARDRLTAANGRGGDGVSGEGMLLAISVTLCLRFKTSPLAKAFI